MRTNKEENKILGERLVQKVSISSAAVTVLLPTKGISQIDAEGGVFYQPEINQVLFHTIKEEGRGKIQVIEVEAHINEEKFAAVAVGSLLEMIKKEKNKGNGTQTENHIEK
jgi:uncharacterized protein (UPF0261 family)